MPLLLKIDNGYHTASWSEWGIEVFKNDGTTKAVIEVSDLYDFTSSGLISSSGTFATSLNNKDTNLVSQITKYSITSSASTDAEIYH